MRRRSLLAVCTALAGGLAGCGDLVSDERRRESPETETITPVPIADVPEDTETSTPGSVAESSIVTANTDSRPAEFLVVAAVENETVVQQAAPDAKQTFQNLSAGRQDQFVAALNETEVPAGEWNPYNESRPRYVRYQGTWYYVIIGVTE